MSFMKLPPELRNNVYRYLLTPIPRQYDRPFAPSLRSYNIIAKLHPSILRVNKLIYQEAYPILYSSNTLVIDFRPRFGNVQAGNATQWGSTTRRQRLILRKGGIYHQGLQLVRHVKILVDETSLWTEPPRMISFLPGEVAAPQSPPAARMLASLLSCLSGGSDSEEVEVEKKKTLKLRFVIQQDEYGTHVLQRFLEGEHDEFRSEMISVLKMAKGVRQRRNVEVELELKHKGNVMNTIDLLELDLGWGSRWGKRR